MVLLASAGSSAPAPKRVAFELQRVSTPGHQGPERLLAASSNKSARPRNSHPCTLGNYDNVQYQLLIEVGKACGGDQPGGGGRQKFRVVPDTGSSDLWVSAANCTLCRSNAARYDPKKSCSAKAIGERITFRYGDGTTAAGVSLRDTVRVGDLEVTNQFLIQVDTMEATTHMQSDGILGLAHHYSGDAPANSDQRGHSFMSTLFREIPDLPRMFSFYLTGKEEDPSQLVFGDADMARHAKETEFRYGKAYYMSHTDLWLTSVYSIGWSGTGVEKAFPERGILGAPALIDSGSSLIVLLPEIYDFLMRELKWRLGNCRELEEQSIIMCDCPPAHDLNGVPSLVINVIDDKNEAFSLCMSPDEFVLQSVDPLDGKSTCVPALQKGSARQPVPMIFGMTFMRAFYTNFDLDHHRIGFARSKQSPLGAGATCSVRSQPLLAELMWCASVVVAFVSVCFAIYVFLLPEQCCGMKLWCCRNSMDLQEGGESEMPLVSGGSSAAQQTGTRGNVARGGSSGPGSP